MERHTAHQVVFFLLNFLQLTGQLMFFNYVDKVLNVGIIFIKRNLLLVIGVTVLIVTDTF